MYTFNSDFLKNAYNLQQITNIIYQIAKACTIYKVAEIIVFDVPQSNNDKEDDKLTVVVGSKVKFVEDEPEKTLANPSKNPMLMVIKYLLHY